MINFRFHLVSLVAVFLALALGVVMGYGVFSQPTFEGLQNRIDRVEARADSIKSENRELRGDVDRLRSYAGQVGDFAVADRLPGVPISVLAARGVDEDAVDQTVELARKGGADVGGIVWLEPKWALSSDGDARALASALGVPPGRKTALRAQAWGALAARLGGGPPVPGQGDVLSALQDAGFLTYQPVGDAGKDTTLARYDGRGGRVLLVDGTGGQLGVQVAALPLARSLLAAGTPLVVGTTFREQDGGPERGATIAALLDDPTLADAISTVDDLEVVEGRTAAVLALADLGADVVGHYGLGEGAEAPLPAWSAP